MAETLNTLQFELDSVLPSLYHVARIALCLPPLGLTLMWVWYAWRYRRVTAAASKLPTILYSWPLIGHFYLLSRGASSMLGIGLDMMKSAVRNNIKTACIWLGPCPLVMVMDAHDIHAVLTGSKTVEKSVEYRFIRFALGDGLLTAPSHIHRVTRRNADPMFHPRNLEKLAAVFNTSGRQLVHRLSKYVDRGEVDVLHDIVRTALRNVVCVLLGEDLKVDTTSEKFKDLHIAVDNIARIGMERLVKPWLWSEAMFQIFRRKDIDDILNSWSTFVQEALTERQYKAENNQNHQSNGVIKHTTYISKQDDESESPLTLPDTYSILTKQYPDFTDKYLLNEIITLGVAGTDSSKSAISAVLMALATHPEVQERLYQEIVSVVGAEDSDVTPKDFMSMPYLDQVFKEAVRVFAVIPLIARHVREDLKLKDVTLPAGSSAVVPIVGLHFDPAVFPDPETFDPERFSPENVAKMDNHAYMPFSRGSRNCIGKGYAAIFLKTSVIHVLRKYRLSSSVNIRKLRYSVAFATVSEDGYFMELHHRHPQHSG